MAVFQKKPELPSHYPRDGSSPEDVIKNFIEKATQGSRKVRETCAHQELCIKYGEDDMQSLDCFYPSSYNPETEVVVFVHGGYWQETSNADYHFIADQILKSGKIAVFLETQNAPQAGMETIIEQCRRGFKAITSRFPAAKHLSIAGHSAGAQKLFMILTHDWLQTDAQVFDYLKNRLKNVVFLCGVYELEHLLDTELNDPIKMTREEAKKNSPILLLPSLIQNVGSWEKCKLFVVYTEFDAVTIRKWNLIFIEEAKKMKLSNMKVIEVKKHDHFSILFEIMSPHFEVTKVLLDEI